MQRLNDWTVSGEVVFIKELEQDEFAASIRIRGYSRRYMNSAPQILEFWCLMDDNVYGQALSMGLDKFVNVTVGGHFETYVKVRDNGKDKSRIMFVCDEVLEVEKK